MRRITNSTIDFDGTIFMEDTGHILVGAHGCGEEGLAKLEEQMKNGERTYREVSEDMWGSLNVPFDDGFVVMQKSLSLDPGFQEFHQYCQDNGFPFHVISAGLKPILKRTLDVFLGEQQVRPNLYLNHAQLERKLTITRPRPSTLSQTMQPSA